MAYALGPGLTPVEKLPSLLVDVNPPRLTSAHLGSPRLTSAHLGSPRLTSAPLGSPRLPSAHLSAPLPSGGRLQPELYHRLRTQRAESGPPFLRALGGRRVDHAGRGCKPGRRGPASGLPGRVCGRRHDPRRRGGERGEEHGRRRGRLHPPAGEAPDRRPPQGHRGDCAAAGRARAAQRAGADLDSWSWGVAVRAGPVARLPVLVAVHAALLALALYEHADAGDGLDDGDGPVSVGPPRGARHGPVHPQGATSAISASAISASANSRTPLRPRAKPRPCAPSPRRRCRARRRSRTPSFGATTSRARSPSRSRWP